MLYNKSELSNFCKTALMAQGVSEKNAQVTTALLIEADEMGIHSHADRIRLTAPLNRCHAAHLLF